MSSLNILLLSFFIYSSFSLLSSQKPNVAPYEDIQGTLDNINTAISQMIFSINSGTNGVESQELKQKYTVTSYLLRISNKQPLTQTFKIIKN